MNFPKDLAYGNIKSVSAAGNPNIMRLRSDNQTYSSSGELIRIEIPTGTPGTHIFPKDSFLEFKAKFATSDAGTGTYYDGNAFMSMFRRYRLFHGSNIIYDSGLGYNILQHVLNDCQRGPTERIQDSLLIGSGNALVENRDYISSVDGHYVVKNTAASSNIVDCAFPLLCPVLGTMATKAVPLDQLNASSLYLEFELDDYNKILVNNGSVVISDFQIYDIFFNAKTVVLPPEINSILISTIPALILPTNMWRVEQKTLAATTNFNDKFSFQYSSANAFLWWAMPQGIDSLSYRSLTTRVGKYCTSYYLNIGGVNYPSHRIENKSRFIMELQRCFNQSGTICPIGIINSTNYLDDPTLANVAAYNKCSRFVAGITLDRFDNSGDTLMSGMNTLNSTFNLNCEFSQNGAVACNLYGAILYDAMIKIEGGLMYVES
jgi:hypothetical protein